MIRDLGSLNGTFVNRHRIESGHARRRRRGSDRQVSDDLPAADEHHDRATDDGTAAPHDRRRLRAACGPSSPTSRSRRSATSRTRACCSRAGRAAATGSSRRTTSSVSQTILRLQRDEFLPLRVIRTELDSPWHGARRSGGRRRSATPADEIDLGELCERAGITAEFARQLEEYDLVTPRIEAGERMYRESEVDIAAACAAHRAPWARRPAPARLPHRRGSPVGTARAAGRDRPALPRPRAAPRGPRRSRGARRPSRQELAQLLLVRDLREVAER